MGGVKCWLIVISIILIRITEIVVSSIPFPLIQQLKQVIIDTNHQNNGSVSVSCPGVILAVDDTFDQQIIDELVDAFTVLIPILVLESDHISSSLLEQDRTEKVCYHLIQFTLNLSESEKLYKKLMKAFYVRFTVMIVMSDFDMMESANRLLQNTQSEDVLVIVFNTSFMFDHYQIYQWGIDDRVHHYNNVSEYRLKVNTITNLMGRKIRMATLHFPPAVFITNNTNTSSLVYGVEPALINLLSSSLNFTIEYIFSSPDEMWGDIITLEDGKVQGNGLRGMLHRKEVDVAFGELYVQDKWDNYFLFSEAFKTNHECFLVPSPKPYPRWMAVIFPFSLSTWIASFFSLIFAVLTLHLVARFAKNNKDSFFRDIILCILFIFGNLLNVQQPRGITSIPNKFLMITWLFAAAITSSAYRSGLFSFHTHPSSPTPIQTIEQLVKSPLNKATFNDFSITNIINSTDPYRRLLGQQLVPTHNISYMFSLLDSSDWAVDSTMDRLLYEAETRYPTNGREDPPFYLMKECILPTRSSFGLQKNSPLKPHFDRQILRFIETGMVKYHRSQFVKELRHLQRHSTSKEVLPFSLDNLQGAFYLFVCGITLSTIVFMIELMIQCYSII